MNKVTLVGRLVKDPAKSLSGETEISRFTLAIDNYNGKERGADFIPVVVFGKRATNCNKYLAKGSLVSISGSIRTGSFEKDGTKHFFTNVVADEVRFLSKKSESNKEEKVEESSSREPVNQTPPYDDFDIPF